MNKKYFFPFLLLILISAAKLSVNHDHWNFKDYDKIEYDLKMSALNEVGYLNQKNGVKVSAYLIVDVIDSLSSNVLVINKKIIEQVNDSVTTFDQIQLEDDLIFEKYTKDGNIEGKISDEAVALKDILFPILAKDIEVGETINEKFIIPFDLANQVIELEVINVISKTKSENGINTYLGTMSSPEYKIENPQIESMIVFFKGETEFQFDNQKGVFLNQETDFSFFVKGKLNKEELSDILTFRIKQDIKLKSLK